MIHVQILLNIQLHPVDWRQTFRYKRIPQESIHGVVFGNSNIRLWEQEFQYLNPSEHNILKTKIQKNKSKLRDTCPMLLNDSQVV